jgi:hypothetical protein
MLCVQPIAILICECMYDHDTWALLFTRNADLHIKNYMRITYMARVAIYMYEYKYIIN